MDLSMQANPTCSTTKQQHEHNAAVIRLGNAIRTTRLERGYTQESFAASAGIDRSYYGAVERGRFNVTIETLRRVSVGLGVSSADLLARAGL
jgi:transcriptional regulator with XRE-family HTH domain